MGELGLGTEASRTSSLMTDKCSPVTAPAPLPACVSLHPCYAQIARHSSTLHPILCSSRICVPVPGWMPGSGAHHCVMSQFCPACSLMPKYLIWDPRQQRFLKGEGLQKHLSAVGDECFRKFSVSNYALQHLFHSILERVLRWEKMDFACNIFLHITYSSHWNIHIKQQHTSVVVAAFDWHRVTGRMHHSEGKRENRKQSGEIAKRRDIFIPKILFKKWKSSSCNANGVETNLLHTCQSGSRIKGNFKSK